MPHAASAPDLIRAVQPDPAPDFVCTMHTGDVGTWVHVAGELDITSSPQLDDVLALTDPRRLIVLDLRALSFLDSSGVQAIVGASTRAHQANGWFMVVRGGAQVDRILRLSGAGDALNIVDLDMPQRREPVLVACPTVCGSPEPRLRLTDRCVR